MCSKICIWKRVFEKVYLGKLMSGHLLSLSRCLLNCKKENRGEYLLKILESQYAKIAKPKFIQNIWIWQYLLKILESQYAKIGKPKLIQNIQIWQYLLKIFESQYAKIVKPKLIWLTRTPQSQKLKRGVGPLGSWSWQGGEKVEIKESGKVDWEHTGNALSVQTQIYSPVLELVH